MELFKALNKQNTKAPAAPELPRTVAQVKKLVSDLRLINYDVQQQDIERFCLSIMSDKTCSHKDRLQAARLLAQLKGFIGKDTGKNKGVNGARIKWATAATIEPAQLT